MINRIVHTPLLRGINFAFLYCLFLYFFFCSGYFLPHIFLAFRSRAILFLFSGNPQEFSYFFPSCPRLSTYHGWSSVRYSLGLWFVAVYFSLSITLICLRAPQCNIFILCFATWRCFIIPLLRLLLNPLLSLPSTRLNPIITLQLSFNPTP